MSPPLPHPSPTLTPGHHNATHTHTYKAVSCTQKHGSCAHDDIEKIYTIYNTPGAPTPPPSPQPRHKQAMEEGTGAVGPWDCSGRRGKEDKRGRRLRRGRNRDPQSEMGTEVRDPTGSREAQRTDGTEQGRAQQQAPTLPLPPRPRLWMSPPHCSAWLAGYASTGGPEGSRSHPAILPGQPAGADASGETRGRTAQGPGRLEEEGRPCGACWGSEVEGALLVKVSLLSECLPPCLSWTPVSPGQASL